MSAATDERSRVVAVDDLGDVLTSSTEAPDAIADVAELAAWHGDLLAADDPSPLIDPAIASPVGPPGSLLRYALLSGGVAPEHLIALYAAVHGIPTALVARAPQTVPVDVLSGCLLDWLAADSSVVLSVDHFRLIESFLGVPAPASYLGAGRLDGLDDDDAARLRAQYLSGLHVAGIIEGAGDDVRVVPGYAQLFEPLVLAEHLAWITWNSPALGEGSLVIGRRGIHSSMLRALGDEVVRIDPLHGVDVAEHVADLLGVADTATDSPALPDQVLASRDLALQAPDQLSLFTIRLVRAADGGGMDAADVSWLRETDGSLRTIVFADPPRTEYVRTAAIDAGELRARLHEAFDPTPQGTRS